MTSELAMYSRLEPTPYSRLCVRNIQSSLGTKEDARQLMERIKVPIIPPIR